jgi:hypothetical protein
MCTPTLPDDDAAWQAKSPAPDHHAPRSPRSPLPWTPLAEVITPLMRQAAETAREPRMPGSRPQSPGDQAPQGAREPPPPRTLASKICEVALKYLAAGRSVVPIAPGRKAPSLVDPETGRSVLIEWERYQQEPATPDEVRHWFSGPQVLGLGVVAGPVSGITLADGTRAGLECLDFDDPDTHARFVERLTAQGYDGLLERMPCDASPRGGHHYGYLCVEWAGSTTLARRRIGVGTRGRAKIKKLIECKGRGGQCVVTPTPRGIHPDHPERGYTREWGLWTQPPLITPEERRVLWACARALDEAPPRPRHANRPTPPATHPRAGRARRLSPPTPTLTPQGEQVRAYILTCSPAIRKVVRGPEGLRALFQHPAVALRCAAALGLPTTPVGQGFRCILPGHEEAHPSASLYRDPKTGALMYRDWHERSDVEWYTLPDVRASLAHREAVRLRGPSVATWQLRLLVEARILEPCPVPAQPLPPGVRPAVRTVYAGFRLLLGCKWWHTPEAPAPFSWRFAAAWCGLGASHVGEARRWLLAQGFLRRVGMHRRTALFLPGTGYVRQGP